MSEHQKNPDELGALWLKKGSKGAYMTGTINGINVFCTPIESTNPKAPTWRVMKSKPKTDGPSVSAREAEVTDVDVPF